jgi:ACS family tartrate transporter-like MFS transporter
VETATQFNLIRFLLGVAEGGFFPADMAYLTHWFRQTDRAKAVALFMTAIPIPSMAGGLIAGVLLNLRWFGVSGWRWLLILEGMPAVIGGVVTLFYLTDRPKDARWLREDERGWIEGELERENREKEIGHPESGIPRALANWTVVTLVAGYFFINRTNYGLILWLPKMVQKIPGLTIWQISLVASLRHCAQSPQ